jgi:hypothetical protein
MIPCPNCGADNMVNAIFCRQCHKKLNLDEISPEAFDEPDDKGKGSAVTRLVTVIIVVLLLAVIGLLLVPAKMISTDNLDDSAKAKAVAKFSALQSPHPGRILSFTNEEATHAAMQALGLPKTGEDKMLPTKISIAFLDGGDVQVVLQQKAFGQVPVCTSVVVTPKVPSAGQMDFEVKKVAVGLLPMFGPLQEKALKPVEDLIGGNFQFSSARGNASSVEIAADKGSYHFTK